MDTTKQAQEEEKTEAVEKPTVEAQEEKPEVFTQRQVNGMLGAERKKEKEKYEAALATATQEWQATETSLRTTIAEYESGIEAVIKAQTSDFPPLVLKMLEKQPVLEQWRLLQDPEFVAEARKQHVPPKTPNSQDSHIARPLRQVGLGGR